MTLSSGLPAADNKRTAHSGGPQLQIHKHLYAHTKSLTYTHTPTRSGTDTYTLRRGWSWRCLLCNSRGQVVANTHQTLATALSGWERGGGFRGPATLMMSSDLNMCHGRSLSSSTFQFSPCRRRICALLLNEISCVATVCNNVTMTSWEETYTYTVLHVQSFYSPRLNMHE